MRGSSAQLAAAVTKASFASSRRMLYRDDGAVLRLANRAISTSTILEDNVATFIKVPDAFGSTTSSRTVFLIPGGTVPGIYIAPVPLYVVRSHRSQMIAEIAIFYRGGTAVESNEVRDMYVTTTAARRDNHVVPPLRSVRGLRMAVHLTRETPAAVRGYMRCMCRGARGKPCAGAY